MDPPIIRSYGMVCTIERPNEEDPKETFTNIAKRGSSPPWDIPLGIGRGIGGILRPLTDFQTLKQLDVYNFEKHGFAYVR